MAIYFRVLVSVLAFTTTSIALAYTFTTTQNGVQVSWKIAPHLQMAGNATNRSGISSGDFFNIVSTSLQRWRQSAQNNVGFDFWQGDNKDIYEPNSDYNGISSIYFSSNANGNTFMDAYALAVTQVWYNTTTGDILETDIVLNDTNYIFSNNPVDSTGPGNGNWGNYRAFLGNVVTHELGHAYGLNHSANLQSTMMYVEAPQEAYPSCDDQTGILASYNPGNGRAQIAGRVIAPGGSPILAANVVAVSRVRGVPMGTALTNLSGDYVIKGLEPGAYTIMVEPYLAPAGSLPPYYSSFAHNFCSGARKFSRTFYGNQTTGELSTVKVGMGGSIGVPTITVQCGPTSGAMTADISTSKSFATAPTIYDAENTSDSTGVAMMDKFSSANNLYYKLEAVEGKLRIKTVAYSLYSMSDTSLELLNSNGQPVAVSSAQNVFTGNSGYKNYDAALSVDGLPYGDYVVHVTRSSIGSTFFPGGSTFVDSSPFMTLMVAYNDQEPAFGAPIPANGRCEQSDQFDGYRSPAGDPPRKITSDSDGEEDGGGFCGFIEPQNRSGPPSNGSIIGWFAPFALIAAFYRLRRLRVASRDGEQ